MKRILKTLVLSGLLALSSGQANDNNLPVLNDAARYAFISDAVAPQLAVVDALEQQSLGNIALQSPAQLIGISKKGGFIAYGKRGMRGFYRLDLKTQQQQFIDTREPIETLAVYNDGNWVAYAGQLGAGLVDVSTGKETPIATQGAVSLVFHAVTKQLFIAELARGRLQRLTLSSGELKTLFDLGKPMSPISIMPNGIALFFVANAQLQRYSLLDEALTPVGMDVPVAPLRPYMSSDSRLILALSAEQPTSLLAVSAYTYRLKQRYPLAHWQRTEDSDHDFMITGWLEQVAVLADDKRLYSLAFAKPDALKVDSNHARVNDMLVQSDSKTLLLTRAKQPTLTFFDMREQAVRKELPLKISQPAQVVMGETNTLCH